jgi:hypothetical protein
MSAVVRGPWSVAGILLLLGQCALGATMSLHITCEGKSAVARVYITDAGGKSYGIPGAIAYSRPGELHSIVEASATAELPPGRYTVRAEKGAEYRSVEKRVELPAQVDLDIPRFYNMNQRGWYSGDLHIHRSAADMPLLIRAEDLNVGPAIMRHVGGPHKETREFPKTNLVVVDSTHVVSLQNQEVERLRTGHGAVLFLNTPEPVHANMTDLSPLDVEFCRWAKKQGGFVDGEKPIWKNVPVNVAFGMLDTIGVVNNHFHPHDVQIRAEEYGSMERDRPVYNTIAGFAQWMMDLYYSFLNCGFRIPVSAGSASGVMASWPGYERVYVHLDGPFSYQGWFEGLKAGRGIATNGPLLEVFVNGKPPGAEFAWKRPKSMRARIVIDVHSQAELDRVEIVFNGEVLRSFPGHNKSEFKTALDLAITQPGWLAVRCFEPVTSTIRYAHTSPFYFLENGKLPVKKSEAERWANYLHALAATVDDEKARAIFRQAEEIYRRLAQR